MRLQGFLAETRTYFGEIGIKARDSFAGFRIGQQYELSYSEKFDEVQRGGRLPAASAFRWVCDVLG